MSLTYFLLHLLPDVPDLLLNSHRAGEKIKRGRNLSPDLWIDSLWTDYWKHSRRSYVWSPILAECFALSQPSVSPRKCPLWEDGGMTSLGWNAAAILSAHLDTCQERNASLPRDNFEAFLRR